MAEAATESKVTASDSKFLEYSGPTPGVKYPLSVIYCPPDSKCGQSFAALLQCWCNQFLFFGYFLLFIVIDGLEIDEDWRWWNLSILFHP